MNKHFEKLAKQLLMKPEGRAALKKYGIDVEIVNDEKEVPIVVTLCPTYRAPEPEMHNALLNMFQYTRTREIAKVYSGPPLSASVVHWSRNSLITEHIKTGKPWTHVLFIDDDITVEPDALERLLSHKKDIVAGLCTCRQDPPLPNFRSFDEATGKWGKIWEWPENSLMEVGGGGTGLMLVSQRALEQVAQAYFDCLWEIDTYDMSLEKVAIAKQSRMKLFDEEKKCFWFRFLPVLRDAIEMGEDMSFCYIAKKYCGIPTYVDTAVQPGHLGPYEFGIKDYMAYQAQCIEAAKAKA